MGERGVCQEEETEVAEAAPGTDDLGPATKADAAAIAASDQASDDAMMKVDEKKEKLNTLNLALHGELATGETTHARALMDEVRLQRDMKKAVAGNEGAVRLAAEEKPERENSSGRTD